MRVADFADQPCNVARPIAMLGDGWTLLVLRQAFIGTRRFDDFQGGAGHLAVAARRSACASSWTRASCAASPTARPRCARASSTG